jgi:hypothetical protein
MEVITRMTFGGLWIQMKFIPLVIVRNMVECFSHLWVC